jgi:hypothetical protein
MINNLLLLSKDINNYCNDIKKKYKLRSRETNIIDAFVGKILATKKNNTQELVTAKLADYKDTFFSRQSLFQRINKLSLDVYRDLYYFICDKTELYFYNNNNNNIIAVDASRVQHKICTKKDNEKNNKNNKSLTRIATCFYNITKNTSDELILEHHKDERLSFLKNVKYQKDNIYLFDRGYFSTNLYKQICDNDARCIVRLKSNSSLINHNNDNDNDIIINETYYGRIVKYIINNNEYYLLTNLDRNIFDSNIIKEMYHRRWDVEEYFKLLSLNTNF